MNVAWILAMVTSGMGPRKYEKEFKSRTKKEKGQMLELVQAGGLRKRKAT